MYIELLPESDQFYKVNMHNHTMLSDGTQTPEYSAPNCAPPPRKSCTETAEIAHADRETVHKTEFCGKMLLHAKA